MKLPKKHKRLFAYSVLLLMAMVAPLMVAAHGPLFKHLAPTASIAEDPESAWNANDVATGQYDAFFEPITDQNPNLDFTTSTFWVTFSVTNAYDQPHTYYIETGRPLTNKVNLYRVQSDSAKALFMTGDDVPFATRPVIYRKFIFPVTLQANETRDLLFEVGSDGEVISLPIKLWELRDFNAFIQRENLTLGIYFGLLIFVAGLFLFFAIVIRQRIYVYYASYVVFLFFMQASLDGLAFEYLWPQWPWAANHSILFFSGTSVFMLMLYAADFLTLRNLPRWFRMLYQGLMTLVLVCVFTGLTSGILYELTFPVINGLSLVSLLVIIGAIIWNQRNSYTVNVFFTLGFLAILAGGVFFILTNFNIIQSDFLSNNAIKLGSAGEITFLSLAMVSRYRQIQSEKENAQREAYKHLQSINRITKNQKIRLEKIVLKRTAEIRHKNEQLAEKNQEVIDSITYAKRIQQAILPPDKYFNDQLPDSFVFYLPKDIVAGDFYWMERIGKTVLFAAADCTGHGVPGAMVSVVCHNALNRAVREFEFVEPADILDLVSRIVEQTFEKSEQEVKDGMDISMCNYDPDTRKLLWAGANNPIWIVTKRHIEDLEHDRVSDEDETPDNLRLYEVKADKQPVGRYANREPFTGHEFQLEEGDVIYLFSDGFADQFGGEKGKKYKTKQFKRFILGLQSTPIQDQHDALKEEFNQWRGDLEQIDDVCVIGMRV